LQKLAREKIKRIMVCKKKLNYLRQLGIRKKGNKLLGILEFWNSGILEL